MVLYNMSVAGVRVAEFRPMLYKQILPATDMLYTRADSGNWFGGTLVLSRRRRRTGTPKASRGVESGEGVYPLSSRLRGLGERRKLPQWGLGRSPSRKRFLSISCSFFCNFTPLFLLILEAEYQLNEVWGGACAPCAPLDPALVVQHLQLAVSLSVGGVGSRCSCIVAFGPYYR